MTRTALMALLSHWRRKPFQMVTLILGLALATALWTGVQAINAEARKNYSEAADILGGGGLSELVQETGAPIAQDTFIALRKGGWLVSPVIDGWLPASGGRVRLLGVDPYTAPPGASGVRDAVAAVAIPDFVGGNGVILANADTSARLGNVGRPVTVVEGIAPGLAIADLETAQDLLDADGFTRLTVAASQPLRQTPLADIAPDLRLETPETADDLGRLTDSFHLNLTAFGLLSFAVGLFIVNGAVGLAFEQRRPVFRTLRALGVPARSLVVLLTVELLVFALIAGAIGILLGYAIAALLLPDVAATLSGIYGATIGGTLTLSPAWWLSGLGIAIAGTALAAVTGLVRVARMSPLAPAKPRAWAMASNTTMRWQLILAGLCLAIATLALTIGDGLVAGFTLLAALLIAAALVLPPTLGAIITLATRGTKSALSEWFWADTRQQLPGLSLALMALLLALSANIGVGTMVESFRLTFIAWTDQRLVSDLYVSAEDERDIDALVAFLEPRSDSVLPIWHVGRDVFDAPAEIYGVVDHPIYAGNWPLLATAPDAWSRLANGEGALINEQMARREDLSPGDPITLDGWETVILGVYSDYGNPIGQVVIAIDQLTQRFENIDRLDFGVITKDTAAVRSALVEDFGLPENNMIDQTALKAFSIAIFERTFAVAGALNVLTLGVAGLAILTSLLTLAEMRLPQLAPIWAIGLTRKKLGQIELLRALLLAALTFLLAIPVGLGLAWVLLAVINVEAFGWRIPMTLFPKDWITLGALSLLAAALASLWPAWKMARRSPSDLVRVFTHER
ncbi:MAG: ABC transporter permease [Paracoccaceae bacterium]